MSNSGEDRIHERFRWIDVIEAVLSIILTLILIWGHVSGSF